VEPVKSRRPRTISIADDDRARIPFALIGVLLFVTSLTVVGILEARPTPETDVDTSVAMDRTSAATQTAIRDATLEATEQAAMNPVHEPADTPYGQLLEGESADEVLERQLELLVAIQVQTALEGAGQELRDTTTTVEVPEASDPDALERAMNRTEIETRSSGRIDVTIDEVRTTVERDGEVVADRTETVTVSVPSPIFELHDRTQAYEEALNTGALEGSGFGRQFSGRLYPIAWARGYAQYGGMPVSEVIANRHVEVTANSAAFATQESVFGTQDADGADAMRQAWLCLAAKDGDDLYGGYNDGDSPGIDSQDVCDSLEYVYGDQVGGEPPDAPSMQELSSHAPGMDEEESIAVSESAYVPMRHLLDSSGDDSLTAAFDRVYEVEASSSVTVHDTLTDPDPEPPDDGDHWERLDVADLEFQNSSVFDVTVDAPRQERSFYTYEGTVVNAFERMATWNDTRTNDTEAIETNVTATSTFEVEVTLREREHSPDSAVKDRREYGIDRKYSGGGPYSDDFSDVPIKAADSFVGTRGEAGFRSLLAEAAEDAREGRELRSGLDIPTSRTIDAGYEHVALEAEVLEDLTAIQSEMADLEVEFERGDVIAEPDEDGPVDDLIAEVEAERASLLDRSEAYSDPAEKAQYEARLQYLDLLLEDLELVADAHDHVMDGLDDELEGANAGLADATNYMQESMSAGDPEPQPIDDVQLLDDLEYSVAGSPSYLVTENVTTEDVPPVREGEEFAPMAAKNQNYFSIPYDSVMTGILSRIPRLGLGDEETEVPMRTAGETLRAAMLAEELGADIEEETAEIEGEIDQEIINMNQRISGEVLDDLNSGEVWDSTDSTEEVDYDSGDVYKVLDNSINEWESVDSKAIALGKGEATDVLIESVQRELSKNPPEEFEDRPSAWENKVKATTRPIIVDEISEATVTFDAGLEDLDSEIRTKLESVSEDVIEKRLEEAEIIDDEGEIVISEEEEWLTGDAPSRVPAGLPVLPAPGYWVVTANVWDVNVDAEYARFEVFANTGDPTDTTGATYLRENNSATVKIDNNDVVLGKNEPIEFAARSVVVVVVPPGGQGVGDRTGVRTECSNTWPESGYIDLTELEECGS